MGFVETGSTTNLGSLLIYSPNPGNPGIRLCYYGPSQEIPQPPGLSRTLPHTFLTWITSRLGGPRRQISSMMMANLSRTMRFSPNSPAPPKKCQTQPILPIKEIQPHLKVLRFSRLGRAIVLAPLSSLSLRTLLPRNLACSFQTRRLPPPSNTHAQAVPLLV